MALSILVMLGVGTAVFVVGKDMSKEAVKSLELITFAGASCLWLALSSFDFCPLAN